MRPSTRKLEPDGKIFPDGTFSVHCPRIKPELLRLLRYDKEQRRVIAALLFLALACTILILACLIIARIDNTPGIDFAMMAVALLPAGLTILVLRWLANWYRMQPMILRNGVLMAGIVVSLEPLHVVCLADLSKSLGKPFLALKRVDAGELEIADLTVGEIMPCVAYFEDIGLDERWGDVYPRPLAWATGDRKALARDKMRLEIEDVALLDRLLRQGKLPAMENELVMLEAEAR